MGHGSYSLEDRSYRSASLGYFSKSIHEVTSRELKSEMNPNGVLLRESRDSDEHPNSIPIIIGLDLTGSMYNVPQYLVRDGLPNIMGRIIQNGIPDPQVLFLGIGDHEYDRAPLQVGQFESNDELLDKWLTNTWLEGGGGGNSGESYLLAWYFAAFHTEIDSFDKRKNKGILVTIGDEPTLRNISGKTLDRIMGGGQHRDYSAVELLEKAKEKYNVYHIHVTDTSYGHDSRVIGSWKEILGDNLIICEDHKLVSVEIPKLISEQYKNKKQTLLNDDVEEIKPNINDNIDDQSNGFKYDENGELIL